MTRQTDRREIVATLGLDELTEDESSLIDWLSGQGIGVRLAGLIMRSREASRTEGLMGWGHRSASLAAAGPTVEVLGRVVSVREARSFAGEILGDCDAVTPLTDSAKRVLTSVAETYGMTLDQLAARAGVDLDTATVDDVYPLMHGMTVRVSA
jgi:hypothetical protein